jgi:hypothetical protein
MVDDLARLRKWKMIDGAISPIIASFRVVV